MVGTDASRIAIEKSLEIDPESVLAIETEPSLISTRNPTENSVCVCEFCGQAFKSEDQVTKVYNGTLCHRFDS